MNTEEYTYEVDLNWENDRRGVMNSPDLVQALEVATPPEFPGGMEGIWSPEHLYVASVNSCLMTTFLAVAQNSKLEFSGFSSRAVGTLEKVDGKFMISSITLTPEVVIKNENDKEKAERILYKSEAGCLISNSIKTEIICNPKVVVEELAY